MKVSIIIPVYNMEDKLSKCLDTVVNQTYKNIEIIIINDGSKDNSLDIINDYAKKDSRIKVINQKNSGISVARNNGLNIATGKYICFADSDDYVEYDMIEKLLHCVKENKADICVCNYYEFSNGGEKKKVEVGYSSLFGGTLLEHPELVRDIDYAPWNKIYKHELFDGISFPVNTKYEDLEAILKVFSKAKKIVKCDEYLYDYYINPIGETRHQSYKNMDMLKIAINLNDYFNFNDGLFKEYFFEIMSQKLLLSASTLFKICDKKTCMQYINDVYSFLDSNCINWKKLYMKNKIDTKYIKFMRGNKICFRTYAYLRTSIYKMIGR